MLKERQRTFTLDKCILKYGEELGYDIWSNRQTKWLASIKAKYGVLSTGISEIGEYFIQKVINGNKTHMLYGTREKYMPNADTLHPFKYDLTNSENKRIIEFNGDYWHCNPNKYDGEYFNKRKQKYAKEIWEYDRLKVKTAEENG